MGVGERVEGRMKGLRRLVIYTTVESFGRKDSIGRDEGKKRMGNIYCR